MKVILVNKDLSKDKINELIHRKSITFGYRNGTSLIDDIKCTQKCLKIFEKHKDDLCTYVKNKSLFADLQSELKEIGDQVCIYITDNEEENAQIQKEIGFLIGIGWGKDF